RVVSPDMAVVAGASGESAGAEAVAGSAGVAGQPGRVVHRDRVGGPASGAVVWCRGGVLATPSGRGGGRGVRPGAARATRRVERRRGDRRGRRVWGRLPHPRKKGGEATGPSPVDRGKTGSKHHLICEGGGVPLAVTLTGGNRRRHHPTHPAGRCRPAHPRAPGPATPHTRGRGGRPRLRPRQVPRPVATAPDSTADQPPRHP